jgi:formylglycine-generating enzyme required for sulfatase activity
MGAWRWSSIVVLGLAPWACIPDVYNDKPGVCSMTGETQCVLGKLQTCGVDYQWHDSGSCAGTGGAGTGGEGGASSEPPSCQGLTTPCGLAQESCCASLPVTGGSFVRMDNGDPTPKTAVVSSFHLDRYEVTVGRFRSFFQFLTGGGHIQSGAGAQPNDPGTGWDSAWDMYLPATDADLLCDPAATWTPSPGANETLPINCVDWHTAFAFCAWDGGRMLTEAEWQYAASIEPSKQVRTYPWGNAAPDSSLAVYCTAIPDTDASPCMSTVAPPIAEVGSRSPGGDGPWGHADLAGNVWEWVLDSPGTYPSSCTNACYTFQESSSMHRGIRGGSYLYGSYYLPSGIRTDQGETTVKPKQGIRCARSP